jgi:hypothetical protein
MTQIRHISRSEGDREQAVESRTLPAVLSCKIGRETIRFNNVLVEAGRGGGCCGGGGGGAVEQGHDHVLTEFFNFFPERKVYCKFVLQLENRESCTFKNCIFVFITRQMLGVVPRVAAACSILVHQTMNAKVEIHSVF